MNKFLKALLFFLSVSVYPCLAQQQFGGIGAQLFLDTMGGHTMPCIQGLVAHSSAEEHLKVTDYIIEVNGISCLDKNIQDVVGMIRGEVGTTVKVTVADTKQGKRPREYDLERRQITTSAPPGTPPIDPAVAFNAQCETEVAQMKKQGISIVKTFPSDCGNYFFNFDAEKQDYNILVMVLGDKRTDATAKDFYISARVFDNTNEAAATQITAFNIKDAGNQSMGRLSGKATFNKPGIGVVNVQLHDDKKKCRAMYVVIYK